MSTDFFGFRGATDLDGVRKAMSELLTEPGACRPLALFYGRPTSPVMKTVILPDIRYFHYRSRNDIECFCIGYAPFDGEYYTPIQNADNDMFQPEDFAEGVRELESHTSWRYSGQTDLVLLNSYRPPKSKVANLDFTTVISFCMEQAEKVGAIASAAEFLERTFNFSVNYKGTNFTYDFSDRLGLREAASGLKQLWFKVLPSPLKESAQKALSFYVKDFSNVEVTAAALRSIDESDDDIRAIWGSPLSERIIREKQRIVSGE